MIVRHILFSVDFTKEELASLKEAADHHYDGVCRQFGRDNLKSNMILDWRDLDILSKICESPLAPEEISQKVWKTFADLRTITKELIPL
jgi:hypothetical protein